MFGDSMHQERADGRCAKIDHWYKTMLFLTARVGSMEKHVCLPSRQVMGSFAFGNHILESVPALGNSRCVL